VTDLHVEVLVPAFALGCVIKSDHLHGSAEYSGTRQGPSAQESPREAMLDWGIKGGFILLAGMALPLIQLSGMSIIAVFTHVMLITIVSNVGKCVPMMAYTEEVTLRERLALRGRHWRSISFTRNLPPAEHPCLIRCPAKHGHWCAQFGVESCAYWSFHYSSDPPAGKANLCATVIKTQLQT
jgi:hypothetical protein